LLHQTFTWNGGSRCIAGCLAAFGGEDGGGHDDGDGVAALMIKA